MGVSQLQHPGVWVTVSYRLAAAVFFLAAATPAFAQESEPVPAPAPAPQVDPAKLDGNSLSIGVAGGVVPSYEGSNDYVVAAVPVVRARVSRINITVRGNQAWADLIPTKGGPGWDLQAGPVVDVNFNRSGAIRDPLVRLLPHRRAAIDVGGYVGLAKTGVITSDYDSLGASLTGTWNVNGVNKSYVITPAINYSTPLSTKAFVALSASADYMGEGYADTYFTITPADSVASTLPAFNAGKGWKDWNASLLGAYSLTGDLTHGLSLIGGGLYRHLLNDAAASPVTSVRGSRGQWTGLLGLAYTF
jgi:outer membrane scaffolding protein for murein synthesis (MipA/OmpV family)